jgi:glycolate oxidase iron-sulfur subunit
MQTNFTLAQLANPDTAESERILRACVHCGFCTATCPTYLLLGDELDSPRGRIYLMKEMLEQDAPATPEVVKHIDRCLSCLACMTTCPSGVHYMHLVDHARTHIEHTYRRPLADRMIRSLIAAVLPYRTRFRMALLGARLARPFAPLLEALKFSRLAAMLRLAPLVPPAGHEPAPGVHRANGQRRARVALLSGCANPLLAPATNAAAVRLLNRHGIEVVIAAGEGCCGALVHHMGRDAQAHGFARNNVDVWMQEVEGEGLDAILITASGCGTTVKDYGYMLRNDPAYAAKAKQISTMTRDISEYIAELNLTAPAVANGLVVAYHPACSLQHGQRIITAPKEALARAGFTVRDIPESHICCGSAGTYNMLQPELATRLRDRKLANINKLAPDVIATGNIGCMTQIGAATDIPIVHMIELIDWASGGPVPDVLRSASKRVIASNVLEAVH